MSKRRIVLWLLMIALMFVVVTRFASLKTLGSTLIQAKWQWVLVAAIMHVVYFVLYTRLYQVSFRVVDVKSSLRNLLPLFFASVFVNAIAPSGGAAAGALFVDDANRRGQSGARAAVGTVLVLVTDLATLIPFLGFGIYFLLLHNNLQFYDIIGAVIFVIFISLLISLLVMAKWKPAHLRQVLNWAQRVVRKVGGWFKHSDLLAEDWAERNAAEFSDASNAIASHPKRLLHTCILGLVLHALNIAGLYTLFLAFAQSVQPGTLIAGFGLGIVFYVVSVVPQGVAAVEGVMGAVFTSMGIPAAKAITIVLTFRGLNYWLPLMIGFFFLHRLQTFIEDIEPDHEQSPSDQEDAQPERAAQH